MTPQSVGSPGVDCRTQLLADLKDWERSDRLNSTSWCAEGCSGVDIYYADQEEKVGRLIRQLEQGKKISREDADEASDAEAIKWGGFSYNAPLPHVCDAAYKKDYPWLPHDQHQRLPIGPQRFGLLGVLVSMKTKAELFRGQTTV